MPIPLIVWGGILVASAITAKVAHDVAKDTSASTEPRPDPEEVRKKRERERVRSSFKRDRSSILEGLNEQFELGIKQESIDRLPSKAMQHRVLLEEAITRKAERLLRLPKKERKALEVMNDLLGQIQQTQKEVEVRLLEIEGGGLDD